MQNQIKATVIADSVNPSGVRITTMELEYPRFIHCFDDETEVLCKVGTNTPTFLLFKEAIEQDAMVAQYNEEDGSVMFVKPNAWIVNEHSGKMISLENHQRINFCVTDEHRMFVGSRKRNGDLKEVILAKELLGDFTQKRFYKSGSNASAVKMNPDLLKLVAFFIADGYLPKYGNQAIFHLKKERKIKEISRLLSNLSVDHDIRKYQDGCTSVVLNRLSWMELCYNSAGEKVLPEQFFNMDSDSFLAFKQGLLESDGSVANNEYNSFSEEYIDQLQALFAVNNSSFNKKKYNDKLFKVKFLTEDEPILRKDKHTVEEVDYDGKVYCASVDTGLLFVRRKGIVHISGNCEFLTHRVFSRNSASSRAIPVAKVIEQVRTNPAMPVHWGKNQAGMQAKEELDAEPKAQSMALWLCAATDAANRAEQLLAQGLHKQVVNRILEPFQLMKVVVTSTEWNNFFWLRDHADAQPEIKVLAKAMAAMDASTPVELDYGMWHLPYVRQIVGGGTQSYYDEQNKLIDIEQAIKISCSSCAQVSYRKLDTSLEKAETIYQKLVESEPVHASAFEHVAKCAIVEDSNCVIQPGWTHADTKGSVWSGNFRGWVQYRQLIPNNAKHG